MNALSGDTYVFAEVDGKYGVYTLRELYELHKQGRAIKAPALLDERGNIGWVEVEDVVSYGKQPLKRLVLATSRLFVELSEDAIIPAFGSRLFSGREKQINLKLKHVNKLKVTQNPAYNNTLLLLTHIPLLITEGDEKEWDFGFALGFFLAEGSFGYRKRKNTKQSLAILNWYAKKKGMTLEEYLEYMTDIQRVYLAVGRTDFERGYVDVVKKHFKFAKPHKVSENGYQLYSYDLSLIRLIKNYTKGHDSRTKRLKNEIYNRSWKFLEGVLDGFLSGDGNFRKNEDLFAVRITTNYCLYNDLIFLSKALGYDVHMQNGEFQKSPSNNNYYYVLRLSIFKTYHRHSVLGLVKEHIKSVEDVGEREAFNVVLNPLYSQDDERTKFNHLFLPRTVFWSRML